jgi:hypothetical protein
MSEKKIFEGFPYGKKFGKHCSIVARVRNRQFPEAPNSLEEL